METKDKILIVEDDETIAAFLIAVLEANGFDTIRASLGREAVTLISSHCPDLVLLDLSLPDMDGMEILAGLRKWSTLPVIVVSARGRERDKVIALDMGADDYLTKPFGPGELLARIRAALRHVRTAAGGEVGRTGVYRCGDLEVDCVRRRVRINGEDIHLTQSEYRILSLLTRHAGKVLTYDFILRELWGPSAGGSNQILRVNVANIRRKCAGFLVHGKVAGIACFADGPRVHGLTHGTAGLAAVGAAGEPALAEVGRKFREGMLDIILGDAAELLRFQAGKARCVGQTAAANLKNLHLAGRVTATAQLLADRPGLPLQLRGQRV